jgi:hypothetical protein
MGMLSEGSSLKSGFSSLHTLVGNPSTGVSAKRLPAFDKMQHDDHHTGQFLLHLGIDQQSAPLPMPCYTGIW